MRDTLRSHCRMEKIFMRRADRIGKDRRAADDTRCYSSADIASRSHPERAAGCPCLDGSSRCDISAVLSKDSGQWTLVERINFLQTFLFGRANPHYVAYSSARGENFPRGGILGCA